MLHCRAKTTANFLLSKYFWTALFVFLLKMASLVWVLSKSRQSWNISLVFRRCKLCWWSCILHHGADSVRACVLRGRKLVYGQSHMQGSSGGDAESTVRSDDRDSYEQCLFAPVPPSPSPLISGRPIARRVPGPSQPSFPHGKYLTLTVAHVCHITRRFRRKKNLLYVW